MADQPSVVKQGYLTKSPPAGMMKGWKRRYFVFYRKSDAGISRMEYFTNMLAVNKHVPKGVIPLSSCISIEMGEHNEETMRFSFKVRIPERVYELMTTSQLEQEEWLAVLRDELFARPAPAPAPVQAVHSRPLSLAVTSAPIPVNIPAGFIHHPLEASPVLLHLSSPVLPQLASPPTHRIPVTFHHTPFASEPLQQEQRDYDGISVSSATAGNYPWLFGRCSRQDTENMLRLVPSIDGTFIVRASTSHKGSYALTVLWHSRIVHHLISPSGTGTLLLNNKECNEPMRNIPTLIDYLRRPHGYPMNWRSPLTTYPGDPHTSLFVKKIAAAQKTSQRNDVGQQQMPRVHGNKQRSLVQRSASERPSAGGTVPRPQEQVFPCDIQVNAASQALGFQGPVACGLKFSPPYLCLVTAGTWNTLVRWSLKHVVRYRGEQAFFVLEISAQSPDPGTFEFSLANAADLAHKLAAHCPSISAHGQSSAGLSSAQVEIEPPYQTSLPPVFKSAAFRFPASTSKAPRSIRSSSLPVPNNTSTDGRLDQASMLDDSDDESEYDVCYDDAILSRNTHKRASSQPASAVTLAGLDADVSQNNEWAELDGLTAALTDMTAGMERPSHSCSLSSLPADSSTDVSMYVADCDYEPDPSAKDRLVLKTGDRLEIIIADHSGWWLARRGLEEGWVPADYLQPCTDLTRRMPFSTQAESVWAVPPAPKPPSPTVVSSSLREMLVSGPHTASHSNMLQAGPDFQSELAKALAARQQAVGNTTIVQPFLNIVQPQTLPKPVILPKPAIVNVATPSRAVAAVTSADSDLLPPPRPPKIQAETAADDTEDSPPPPPRPPRPASAGSPVDDQDAEWPPPPLLSDAQHTCAEHAIPPFEEAPFTNYEEGNTPPPRPPRSASMHSLPVVMDHGEQDALVPARPPKSGSFTYEAMQPHVPPTRSPHDMDSAADDLPPPRPPKSAVELLFCGAALPPTVDTLDEEGDISDPEDYHRADDSDIYADPGQVSEKLKSIAELRDQSGCDYSQARNTLLETELDEKLYHTPSTHSRSGFFSYTSTSTEPARPGSIGEEECTETVGIYSAVRPSGLSMDNQSNDTCPAGQINQTDMAQRASGTPPPSRRDTAGGPPPRSPPPQRQRNGTSRISLFRKNKEKAPVEPRLTRHDASLAVRRQLSDQGRIDLMNQVKVGKLSIDEAISYVEKYESGIINEVPSLASSSPPAANATVPEDTMLEDTILFQRRKGSKHDPYIEHLLLGVERRISDPSSKTDDRAKEEALRQMLADNRRLRKSSRHEPRELNDCEALRGKSSI